MTSDQYSALQAELSCRGFESDGKSLSGELVLGKDFVCSLSLADFLVQHVARRERILQRWEVIDRDDFVIALTEAMNVVAAGKSALRKLLKLNTYFDSATLKLLSDELVVEGFSPEGESPRRSMDISLDYLHGLTFPDFLEGQVIRREQLVRSYPLVGKRIADLTFDDVERAINATCRAISTLLARPE